ncbi:pVII [Bottlenose dolphin adenovirus 1]|uniref:PVII n=1 Tax=Bottlenose dolphin adenovirus 1 TaxID=1714377 RepID=A0A1X7MPY3_9ADEN|nr:pVII [Bottlenose dolphin adenovirus 1]SMG83445.1 pVII [Bottlenose dolphin adenovirus 1]
MALLVSPSNNTGWGVGAKIMYGGARTLSADHPVRVVSHYRASWGSKKGRVPRSRSRMVITNDPVADVVNAIGPGRRRRGHRRGGRSHRRHRHRRTGMLELAQYPSIRGRVARRGRLPRVVYHPSLRPPRHRRGVPMPITSDPVADVVNAVAASTADRLRRESRRARHSRMRITSDPVADVVDAVARSAARRAARRANARSRRQEARMALQNARRAL